MKNSDLNKSIQTLEKEIKYLYIDYVGLINRDESFKDINQVMLKIKHAEESLRFKKRMLNISLN